MIPEMAEIVEEDWNEPPKEEDWIKIEDRYPKKYQRCLVWTKAGMGYAADLYENFVIIGSFNTVFDVTHWMPFPKGPDEEK